MTSKSFYESLEIIASERNLDINDVLEKVAVAMKKACQLEGIEGDIQVEFNPELKKIRVFSVRTVVDEIDPEGPEGQILLDAAKELKSRVRVGSVIKREVNFEKEVGRKGASQFKQIFTQGLKELGRKRAFEFFQEHENEMITATVNKIFPDAYVLGIGMDYDAYMPKTEALPTEELKVGDKTKVYITKVEETPRGPKVYVSRTTKDIVKRLFEMAVPEIANGTIEIMNISRGPGYRSKVGVKSNNPLNEPKGACVGFNGLRIKQINEALNDEKIDIFQWQDDPIQLIASALMPAKAISILPDEANHQCIAIVPDKQFTLAIGIGGQNVRLASQVTGWKIDIKSEDTAYKEGIRFKPNVAVIK